MKRSFQETYEQFRIAFFRNLYDSNSGRKYNSANLLDAELIYLMKRPTISQFARAVHISLPNATYRVKQLTNCGLVTKVVSLNDKREYILEVTDSFYEVFGDSRSYGDFLWKKFEKSLTPEEISVIDEAMALMEKVFKEEEAK